jgi:23S rRNA pseudouridine1911/1915/1917 synthase
MAGRRLDQVLVSLLPDLSRAFLRKVIDSGGIRVAGETAKASRRLRAGEVILATLPAPVPDRAQAEDLPLDVLYEDNDLVVVNKRPGMVAHPSAGHRQGTLVNALLHHYGESLSGIGGVLRPGIVHRLDRDTSGCLVAAKNDQAHQRLIQQFMAREVGKTYLALTQGSPMPPSGRVEVRLGRDPRHRRCQAVLPSGGRMSLTLYQTRERFGRLALVECELKTGRTHQARVHLSHLGTPVLCDQDYGQAGPFTSRDLRDSFNLLQSARSIPEAGEVGRILLDRQALHAWKLSFQHPRDNRPLQFMAPLPADLENLLGELRAYRDRPLDRV